MLQMVVRHQTGVLQTCLTALPCEAMSHMILVEVDFQLGLWPRQRGDAFTRTLHVVIELVVEEHRALCTALCHQRVLLGREPVHHTPLMTHEHAR